MYTLLFKSNRHRRALKALVALAACSGALLQVEQSFAAAPRPIAELCAKSPTVESNNRILKRTSGNMTALLCRAAAYLSVGAPDKALPDLEQVTQRAPTQAQAFLLLGRAYLAQNNAARAIDAYQQALVLNSEWPDAYTELAAAQADLGRTNEAVHNLTLARMYLADPLQRVVLSNAAQGLVAGKPLPEFAAPDGRSLSELNDVLAAAPGNVETRLTRARLLLDQGQSKKALADLAAAIKANPKNAESYVQRGLAYARGNNAKRATADFARAIALDPQNPAGYSARATLLFKTNDFERAVNDFSQAIKLDQADPYLYMNRGRAYMALGRNDEALADFKRLLALDSRLLPGYLARAEIFDLEEEFDKAIQELNQAIGYAPDMAALYVVRGRMYVSRLNESTAGLRDFDQAIRLQPRSPEAHYERGVSLAEDGKFDQAVQSLNAAIKLDERNALAFSWRGYANLGLRQFQLAVRDSSTAIKLLPRQPHSYCDRGEAYKALGQNNKAIKDFQQCIRFTGNDEGDAIAHARSELRSLQN